MTLVATKAFSNILERPVIVSVTLRNGDAIHTGFLGPRQCTVGGEHLVRAENDWWDLCLAYVANDHLTISGGYANFGNVRNHREDSVFAAQIKYEF